MILQNALIPKVIGRTENHGKNERDINELSVKHYPEKVTIGTKVVAHFIPNYKRKSLLFTLKVVIFFMHISTI